MYVTDAGGTLGPGKTDFFTPKTPSPGMTSGRECTSPVPPLPRVRVSVSVAAHDTVASVETL